MLSKRYAKVDREICVACGACTRECPKSVISIFRGCYAVAEEQNCVGCGKCAGICPAGCISLAERRREEHEEETLV